MASTGEAWRLGRRPALDGLRGIAVLLVVISHGFYYPSGFGTVGVSMFFALSGFLITSLLLEERQRSGSISLRGFYARRARRLLPALVVFLGFAVVAGYTISTKLGTPAEALRALLYVANWIPARGGSGGGLGHTWSLSVEEQFYLTFPLVAVATLRRWNVRMLLWLTLAGIVGSLILRGLLWEGTETGSQRVYFGTDTSASALLIGCVLAILMHGSIVRRSRPLVATGLLALVVPLGLTPDVRVSRLVVPVVVPLATAVVIWLVTRGPCTGWLTNPVLRYFGERSYGLYLWHFPILGIVVWETNPPPLMHGLLIVATLGIVEASWRLVERPILRLGADAQHRQAARQARVQNQRGAGVLIRG